MLGSALYFPHIDIDDPAWLRSAILFWDDIQTIAPSSIEQPYRNNDSMICAAEGYLKPLRCDLHPDVINDLGRKVMGLTDRNAPILGAFRNEEHPAKDAINASQQFSWDLNNAFDMVGLRPDKLSPELRDLMLQFSLSPLSRRKFSSELRHIMRDLEFARMHPNKLSHFFQRAMEFDNHYRDEDGDWLLVDGQFAEAYMAAMASRLAKEVQLSPLTSTEPSQGLSFRFLFDNVIENSNQSATGALVSVAMRGLAVDASVSVEKLIRFRRNRNDQYIEMAQKLLEFSEEISGYNYDGDGNAMLANAQTTYEREIEPQLRALKRELDNSSIQTAWEGAFRALTVSVPSAGALNYLTGLTGGTLLGAGALLTVADVGVRSYLAGRRSRGSNPFSYLQDVRANFGLPEFQEN